MPTFVNDNGTWKEPIAVSANTGAAWEPVIAESANDSGTWEEIPPSLSSGFDPASLPFWWEYDTAKTGYASETGGDGNPYFVSAPNLGVGSAGSLPGFSSGASSADHALASPAGWKYVDGSKGIQLATVSEKSLKTSMGAAELVGTGPSFNCFLFTDAGSSNNSTQQGSGSLPGSKYETVSGTDRLKYTDAINTAEDGSGTAVNEAIFNFSPQPVPGDKIFMAYQRDTEGKKVDFWFGILTSGSDFATIQKTNSTLLTTPVFVTAPRNDNQQDKTYFFNEGTTFHAHGRSNYLLTDSQVGDIFNHLITQFT
jgi:hypothetical protein